MLLVQDAFDVLWETAALVEPDYIKSLIAEYIETGNQLLDQMDAAYAQQDAKTLHRAAHTLKGHAMSYGALEFADICLKLELQAKTGDLGGAQEQINHIREVYPEVIAALEAEIERRM